MRVLPAILCSAWILGIGIGSFSVSPAAYVSVAALLAVIFFFRPLPIQAIIASIFVLGMGILYGGSYVDAPMKSCEVALPMQGSLIENRGMYATHTLSVFKSEEGCSLLVYAPRTPVLIKGATARLEGKAELVADVFKGLPGYVKFLHEEGISHVVDTPTITLISQGTSRISRARIGAMQRLGQVFAEPDAGILTAMMIGDRGMIPRDVTQAFQQSGITHILSISGFHVSLLAGVLALVVWRLPIPRWLYFSIVFAVLWSYIIAIGLQSAAVRAGIFWTLFMLAYRARALVGLPTVLLITLSLILTVDPTLARSIGFQLSIAAVTGIGVAVIFLRRMSLSSTIRPLAVSLTASLGATIATLPLTAYYFGNLSFIGILVNILVIPLVAMGMYTALGALVLYAISKPLGLLLSYMVHLCIQAVLYIAYGASRIPYGSFQEVIFPAWGVGVYYALCIALVIYLMRVFRISLREVWV